MSTARYAHGFDTPRIVALAREEHDRSPWAQSFPFSPGHVEHTVAHFLVTPGRTVFVSDGGYLLGLVQPIGFSPVMAALEFAWYANDGSGFDLLRAFDRWAARMGAATVVVHTHGGGERDARLAAALQRRHGFEPLGRAMHRAPTLTE